MTRILWFHPRALRPAVSGGDHRTWGEIVGMLERGHEVLLVDVDDRPPCDDLPDGLTVCTMHLRRGVSRLAAKLAPPHPIRAPRATRASLVRARPVIARFAPEVAVVSEVMTRPLSTPLIPAGVPWIYDSQNVERALFGGHRASARSLADRVTFAIDARRVDRAERALLSGCSMLAAVSKTDADELRAIEPRVRTRIVPSSMFPPSEPCRPSDAPPVALFVGQLDFPPNVEAIGVLVTEIFPQVISRQPAARLQVIGRHPTRPIRTLLGSAAWIDFHEDVPSVDPAYRSSRCVVMPFRSGSGTKLKLFEALAFGMPVVATPRGVVGVPLPSDSGVTIVEGAGQFANAVAGLLADPERADANGARARAVFNEYLSWPRASWPELDAMIRELAGPPVA